MRRPYRALYRDEERQRPVRARSDDVEDLRRSALLRDVARAFAGRGGGADRQRLRPRRAAAIADGVPGRNAEADRDFAGWVGGVDMIGGLFQRWAISRKAFISGLRSADGEELGMVVAFATDWRRTIAQSGIDLLYPDQCIRDDPFISYKLAKKIGYLQKAGKPEIASGLMVWVHTLRSIHSLELRPNGREMWGELERGFAWVEVSAEILARIKGFPLDVHGYNSFPDGLTPKPLP